MEKKKKSTIEFLEDDAIEKLEDEFQNDEQQEDNDYSFDSIENLEDSTTDSYYNNYNDDEVLSNIEEQPEEYEEENIEESTEEDIEYIPIEKEDIKSDVVEDDTIRDVVEEEIKREKKKEQSFAFNNTKIIKAVIFIVCGVILALGCIKFFSDSDKYYGNSKYYLTTYDENESQYKPAKQLSIYDSIIIRDIIEDKDIRYDFKITNGKVTANNSYGMYELKTIENAKKLVVTPMGNLTEYTGVFILTKDGKFYSISLYDDKGNLITSCDELEKNIKTYDFSFAVKDLEAGFYGRKDGSGTEGIILITDTNDGKHVLATKKSEK